MSSAKENTVRSSKKVPCYCPRCNGKSIDPRTKRDHINLADIGSTSISEEQSSSKRKHNEEPLPELPKHGNSESEDSKNEDTESENTESEDSDDEDSNRNNSESNHMESNGSESEKNSTTNEEDSSSSDENSIASSTNSINTFLEDDFEEQSPIIERSAKDKFKQPSPVDNEEEINIEQSLEVSSPYDVYQPSDDDEVMMILDEEPDDSPSPSDSSNNSNDTASESSKNSQESHGPINFIPPEIDPEIFDPLFTFDDNNKNEWIILWIMKYQQRFNISDIGIEALIKFLRYILIHFKINEADNFPTSMFTAKSSLGILTKYKNLKTLKF